MFLMLHIKYSSCAYFNGFKKVHLWGESLLSKMQNDRKDGAKEEKQWKLNGGNRSFSILWCMMNSELSISEESRPVLC